jgi:tight adherence protein C
MVVWIAAAGGALMFCLAVLCLAPVGMRQDRIKRRLDGILNHTQKVNILDEELNKPLSERIIKPALRTLVSKLEKLIPQKSRSKKKAGNEKLKKTLRQAGFSISAGEYSLLRLFIIFGLAVLSGITCAAFGLGVRSLLGALFGLYAGYVVMRFHLSSTISKRRKSMEEQTPDVLDLLSVNVEAGLGFEQALLHVIGHFEGPLIDELTVMYREMTRGRTRREALTLFAERCELNEIKTFAGAIIQAEQLGISIKNILRTQAAAMRTARRNKVEEKAMKISVKIILPMVGLIFPVLLIVLMGPAALKIIHQFMR